MYHLYSVYSCYIGRTSVLTQICFFMLILWNIFLLCGVSMQLAAENRYFDKTGLPIYMVSKHIQHHIIPCMHKRPTKFYMLLYVPENDDGFVKCMELSLEDWFPILPRSWLHLYSMPVAPWPLVLLWCGRQKHKPGWGREREGRGIAKGETVYNEGGGGVFLWCGFLGGMRLVGVCRERCEPMKPSSDRSVRVSNEGGCVVGVWAKRGLGRGGGMGWWWGVGRGHDSGASW